jgi:hypothetical protein
LSTPQVHGILDESGLHSAIHDASRDFLVGSSDNEIFYKVILATQITSGFADHQTGAGKNGGRVDERIGLLTIENQLPAWQRFVQKLF